MSVATYGAPSLDAALRNGKSETPVIGAVSTRPAIVTQPILKPVDINRPAERSRLKPVRGLSRKARLVRQEGCAAFPVGDDVMMAT